MKPSDFLPLLGVVSGVFGVYVDPKAQPKWRIAAVAGVILTAFISMGASYDDGRTDNIQKQSDKLAEQKQFAELESLILKNNGVRDPGFSLSNAQTSARILDATKAKLQAVAALPTPSASGIQIQYFPHFSADVDSETVSAALRQIGASVQESAATPGVKDLPTNCIWIGDHVSDEEWRAVALTLIAAGVQLRDVRYLRDPSGAHASLIEIGSSAAVKDMPPLTAGEVSKRQVSNGS